MNTKVSNANASLHLQQAQRRADRRTVATSASTDAGIITQNCQVWQNKDFRKDGWGLGLSEHRCAYCQLAAAAVVRQGRATRPCYACKVQSNHL
jgi:hypothetical protein